MNELDKLATSPIDLARALIRRPSVTPLDAGALDVSCHVNGERMQKSNTRELIFKPADIIEYASRYFTLNAGDLIFTGTPGGVGVFRKPPIFLKDGDECVVEIEGLGRLTNAVRATRAVDMAQPVSKRARL